MRITVFNMVCIMLLGAIVAAYSAPSENIPKSYEKYMSDPAVFRTDICEFPDALIIYKRIRVPDVAGRQDSKKNTIAYYKEKCLFGPEKAKWIKLYDKEDKIYETGKTGGLTYSLSAVTVDNWQVRTWELYFDILLTEKNKGRPVILRYVHRFLYKAGGGGAYYNKPVPQKASLAGSGIIRLEFKDGAVEHWNFIPGFSDIQKNNNKYGSAGRNLLWMNKKGKGSFKSPLRLTEKPDDVKAWNYSDSAKEPVYK